MIREGAAAFLSGGGATNDASTGGIEHKISCAEAGWWVVHSTRSFARLARSTVGSHVLLYGQKSVMRAGRNR